MKFGDAGGPRRSRSPDKKMRRSFRSGAPLFTPNGRRLVAAIPVGVAVPLEVDVGDVPAIIDVALEGELGLLLRSRIAAVTATVAAVAAVAAAVGAAVAGLERA